MNVSLEECEQSTLSGHHRSPPLLARTKSGSGSIVVDMGIRGDVEVRAMDMHSPNKKAARPEPASRIHLIPLLMILVFFVLWAGSTEVPLGEDLKLQTVMVKMPTTNNFATAGQHKVVNDETPQQGIGTALQDHDHGSHKHVSLSTNGLPEKMYLRGASN